MSEEFFLWHLCCVIYVSLFMYLYLCIFIYVSLFMYLCGIYDVLFMYLYVSYLCIFVTDARMSEENVSRHPSCVLYVSLCPDSRVLSLFFFYFTHSTANATPPKSAQSRNSNSLVQILIKPQSEFEFVPRDTEGSDHLDLVAFGDVACLVKKKVSDTVTQKSLKL